MSLHNESRGRFIEHIYTCNFVHLWEYIQSTLQLQDQINKLIYNSIDSTVIKEDKFRFHLVTLQAKLNTFSSLLLQVCLRINERP